jgi:WD40 repeat protein
MIDFHQLIFTLMKRKIEPEIKVNKFQKTSINEKKKVEPKKFITKNVEKKIFKTQKSDEKKVEPSIKKKLEKTQSKKIEKKKVEKKIEKKKVEKKVEKKEKPKNDKEKEKIETQKNENEDIKDIFENYEDIGSNYKFFQNLNYQNYRIKKITAVSFNEDYSLLAVGKNDGSIQIFVTIDDHFSNWTLIKYFPGKINTTVEKIIWIGDRLYSAGLHSYITEWDFTTLSPKV